MREMGGPVTIVVSAIGGYGYHYLKTLLEEVPAESYVLRGAVDRAPQTSPLFAELKGRGVPIFGSIKQFYESGNSADLAVISSPIHFHVPQSLAALAGGSDVLCDKPVGATVQAARELIDGRDVTDKWVMIGFQWSYSSAIQSLKKDIIDGLFGAPIRLKTLCLWPRDRAYYERNDWAGRIKSPGGRWVLDSPANNAMAHYLHNLFYVIGEDVESSALPASLVAEAYRVYPIENFDSVICRAVTHEGVELLFFASHATADEKRPIFEFEFEDAKITFDAECEEIIARDKSGREKRYGSPDDDHQFKKLFIALEAAGKPARVVCGPEAALSHTLCVNGIQESVGEALKLPSSMILSGDGGARLWGRGLDEAFLECYEKWLLPSEAGYSWAQSGAAIDLSNYDYFPGGVKPNDGEEG